MSKSTDELPGIYAAELLCSTPPKLDRASLLPAIRYRLPDSQPLDDNQASDLLAFVHPKHTVTYKEGALPAQSFVHVSDQPPKAESSPNRSSSPGHSRTRPPSHQNAARPCSSPT